MATTKACKDVVDTMGKYMDPMRALICIQDYSRDSGMFLDDFTFTHLPKFILYLASRCDQFKTMNEDSYNKMLKDLMYLSNLYEKKESLKDATAPA